MKSYIKHKLLFILVIIVLYLTYRYLTSYENFEELGTLYSSKMNEAMNVPILQKWTYLASNNWYKVKINNYRMYLRDLNFTQYNNISISFFLQINTGSSKWRNVFQFTQDGENCCQIGQRIPAMWIRPDNTPNIHIRFSTDSGGGNDGIDTSSIPNATISFFKPYLITLVFNNNNFTFYINKTQVLSNNYNNIIKRNRDTLMFIGAPWDNEDDGVFINNFTLYDGVLSQGDVNNIVTKAQESPSATNQQGIPGPAGPAGPAGIEGKIGPAGPEGPAGVAGPAGPAGVAGTPGTPGQAGERGDKGDIGVQGPAGERGDKGDKGDIGVQGPAGPQGPNGEIGVQGPPGPQGQKGDIGMQGPKGDIGPQGPKGDVGPKGPLGPQGLPSTTSLPFSSYN